MSESFFLRGLTEVEADEQARFYRKNGGIPEKSHEGRGLYSLKVTFLDESSNSSSINWSTTPTVAQSDWHSWQSGMQEWRFDDRGIFLRAAPNSPLRTGGASITCGMIIEEYGAAIYRASVNHQIPPEIIVMTIATETGAYRQSKFTGPKTFRWEAALGTYSAGPMQILATTARSIIQKQGMNYDPEAIAPKYPSEPRPPPVKHRLYEGDVNIDLGTAVIKNNVVKTGLDPILIGACYNSGGLRNTQKNLWGLSSHGDHLDRASKWFGDACVVLAALRQGDEPDTAPQGLITNPQEPDVFELRDLTEDVSKKEAQFFRDSGATVDSTVQADGLFTLRIAYAAEVVPLPVVQPPADQSDIPDLDGFVVCIDRVRSQRRQGSAFPRTVGIYRAFYDRQPIPNLSGQAAERQGPGENSKNGTRKKSRIEQGVYPLFTHAGESGRYKTYGYANTSEIGSRPWPCVRVGSTGSRAGILIHCANGYLMSEGCINLASSLPDVTSSIVFSDSRNRVVSLINGLKNRLGDSFPRGNNQRIPNAWLVIRGEPL